MNDSCCVRLAKNAHKLEMIFSVVCVLYHYWWPRAVHTPVVVEAKFVLKCMVYSGIISFQIFYGAATKYIN
jgi:hypothetical protein